MRISVRTSKLESVDFDGMNWTVDDSGYLWINEDEATVLATFAPGEWRHVMTAAEA